MAVISPSPSVHLHRDPGFSIFDIFTVTGRLLLYPPEVLSSRLKKPNSLSFSSQEKRSNRLGTLACTQLITLLICFPNNLLLSQLHSIALQLGGGGAC